MSNKQSPWPLGAVMQGSLLLQLLILLVVANGTAVVAKKLLAKIERVTKRTLT